MPQARRVVILGAAGRDFHNFNVVFRDDPNIEVVGFTAAQIPGIVGRRYPPSLAGPRYPDGIAIYDESELEVLCRSADVDTVVLAYSDLSSAQVITLASRTLATGADFELLGPVRTMLQAPIPVIAISAVRTGCGKSAIARWLGRRLRADGRRVAILRHPMPYGDLERQSVQRFASVADLDAANCTIEEREEYEPHIAAGNVVFAGVDYAAVTEVAGTEADIIVWDGGNNDFPFLRPDLHICIVDALRPEQVRGYYPGEAVARMADVIVINKVDAASAVDARRATEAARELNPTATTVRAASPVHLDDVEAVRGKRVLVIEDGPTITHGGMPYGAGYVAATAAQAAEIVDPRGFVAPAFREVYERYPHIGKVLPALGYGAEQLRDLEASIRAVPADVIVAATPIDLARLLDVPQPVVRARYEYADAGQPTLGDVVDDFLRAREARADGAGD